MGKKSKKALKILAITLISVIVFVLILRGIFNYIGTKKVNLEIEKLKKESAPFEFKDFEIKCEPEENGAIIWKKIEKQLSGIEKNKELISTIWYKMLDGKQIKEDEKAKIEEVIISQNEIFPLFIEIVNKPFFKYADNWDDLAWNIKIPKLITIKRFMELWGINAFLFAEQGNYKEALEFVISGIKFTNRLLDEPLLITYLMASSIYREYIELLNRIVSSNKIENELLYKILERLNANIWREKFVWSVKAERAFYFDTWSALLKGNRVIIKESGMPPKFFIWLLEPFLKYDFIYAMKLYSYWTEISKLPYSKIVRELEYKELNIPNYYILSSILIPNFKTSWIREKITEASAITAKVGIGCKIYHNNYGKFPDELSQLVPVILPEIPGDPFTGKSLIYRKHASGFLIYSVGVNLKDDGGRETRELEKLVSGKNFDICWSEGKQ